MKRSTVGQIFPAVAQQQVVRAIGDGPAAGCAGANGIRI
jgi:hypothetical protein